MGSRQRILGLLLVISLMVIGFGWLGLHLAQRPDFQEYKPTVLPKGIISTTSDYYLLSNHSPLPPYRKGLNINLNLPNSWISETKVNGLFNHTCRESLESKNCKVMTSQKAQQYQLVTANDTHANQTVYEISFVKGGTAIWTTMRTVTGGFDNQDWGTFVDSFITISINPTRTIHHNAKGP